MTMRQHTGQGRGIKGRCSVTWFGIMDHRFVGKKNLPLVYPWQPASTPLLTPSNQGDLVERGGVV